jgi:hypothetical protein
MVKPYIWMKNMLKKADLTNCEAIGAMPSASVTFGVHNLVTIVLKAILAPF